MFSLRSCVVLGTVTVVLAVCCLYSSIAFTTRNAALPVHSPFRRPFVVNSNSEVQQQKQMTKHSNALQLSAEESATATVAASDSVSISAIKEGIKFPTNLNGSDVRVGIIMARWNADIIQGLYKGVNQSLTQCGVKPSNVFTTFVPGAYEIPITAKFLSASKRVDVIIALGCLIKGETMHFEYIASAVSQGLMQVSVDSFVPCIFGVLTVLNKEQAIARSTGTDSSSNEGVSWGMSAVEMGLARMSALGMDKRPSQGQQQDSSAPFLQFVNGTLPGDAKNATQPKRIGF